MLGGTVLVLALELLPFVFPRFSDLVSLSQSRRAAGFVPFAFALVGGAAVLARALRGRCCRRSRSRPASCCRSSSPATSGRSSRTAAHRSPPGSRSVGGLAGLVAATVLVRSRHRPLRRRATRAAGRDRRAVGPPLRPSGRRARLRELGHGASQPTRARSRPASSASCGTTSRSAPSSSRISRRATASPPTRRSTSRTARRPMSPTPRPTARPRGEPT